MIFTIVGYICSVLLCIIGVIITFHALVNAIGFLYKKLTHYAIVAARQSLGSLILRDSYWFSDNKEVFEALSILGKAIQDHPDGIYDMDKVRDCWREKVKNET